MLLCGENKLFYYFKSGETQQQLFIACITEMNGSFGIVARTFYANHLTQAEAFVLDGLSGLYAGDAGSGSRRWGERSPTYLFQVTGDRRRDDLHLRPFAFRTVGRRTGREAFGKLLAGISFSNFQSS